MRTRVRETFEREAVNDGCPHYWLIESAKGPTSRGVCKACGATKDFFNAIPEGDSMVVKPHVAFKQMPKLDLDSSRKPNES